MSTAGFGLLAGALVAAAACYGTSNRRRAASGDFGPDSLGVLPRQLRVVPTHARPELTENSAAVMSRRQPAVFFTINDSGNEPVLYAMDTSGADRGAWRVIGATDVDWESGSVGPCPAAPDPAGCVYVGDTGDNFAHHATRAIYRMQEPAANGQTDSITADRLTYVYADGPHDVEALYVAPDGDMFLITKRGLKNPAGGLRQALVFELPADAWTRRHTITAHIVDSLPIVPGSAPMRNITDASLAPDARHLAVRTYSQLYIFATDSLTGRVNHAVPPTICNLIPLGERQGEGVTWLRADGRLLFTSERQTEPIRLANCPLPG